MSEENKDLKICPCCKERTLKLPVKMKDIELQNYIACMLTGEPFKKTYKLFNSLVQITLIDVTDAKLQKMQMLSTKVKNQSNDQKRQLLSNISQNLITKSPLYSIKIKKQDTDINKVFDIEQVWQNAAQEALKATSVEDLKSILSTLTDTKQVSSISFLILKRVIIEHNALMNAIAQSGFDSDFFTTSLLD